MQSSVDSSHDTASAFEVLVQASWFGLVCGLIDGLAQVIFQHLRWINWSGTYFFWVSRQILWASPLIYLFLFNLIGASLLVVRRLSGKMWHDLLPFNVFL